MRLRILSILVAFALLFSQTAVWADATGAGGGNMATNILSSLSGFLGGVNQTFSSYGAQSAQLQATVAQINQAQTAAGGVQNAQAQFNQIGVQLQMAAMQAQSCVAQATKNYDKYMGKRKGKQLSYTKQLVDDPAKLQSEPLTCSNTAEVLDAAAVVNEQMKDANAKMMCLSNLRNTVNQIAEKARAPFQTITDAANQVYETDTSVIDAHNKIADQLDLELNGKDGKGGYRDALAQLKQRQIALNNILNGKPGAGGKDAPLGGFAERLAALKHKRADTANNWYRSMLRQVDDCFKTTPVACFDNKALPPAQCIGAVVQNSAVGNGALGQGLAMQDLSDVGNAMMSSDVDTMNLNLAGKIDANRPDQFLSFAKGQMDKTLAAVMQNYSAVQFRSGVNKNQILAFVQRSYSQCYAQWQANYSSQLKSGTGATLGPDGKGQGYYADIVQQANDETELANDVKNEVDTLTNQMNDFRTAFQKVYSSELPQFQTNCTASGDPYQSFDCLKVLKAELDTGIAGTSETVKFGNGTSTTISAGATALQVQTLTVDATGKAAIGSATAYCSGFDDCLNYMDRNLNQHRTAAGTATDDRTKFVQQHNAAVKSSFDAVAARFSQISDVLQAGIAGVNQDLAKIGIKAQVTTKSVDAETLAENDKTGIIDMPKSMIGALASRNAYTEIDTSSTDSVTSAYNDLADKLAEKATKANEMRAKCRVRDGDYKGLLSIVPSNCNSASLCQTPNRVATQAGTLQKLFQRSLENPDDLNAGASSSATADYNNCVNDVKTQATGALTDDAQVNNFAISQPQHESIYYPDSDPNQGGQVKTSVKSKYLAAFKAQLMADAQKDIAAQCGPLLSNGLGGLASDGRGELGTQNSNILQKLVDLDNACANAATKKRAGSLMPVLDDSANLDSDSSPAKACEDFKAAVNAAKAPADEEETAYDNSGTGGGKKSSGPVEAPKSYAPAN